MKTQFFYIITAAGLMLSGCSAAFRTAQTPDDVYFSEGQVVAQQTRNNNNNNGDDSYTSYWENQDDNYLRMKVQDRNRWGGIDDIDYWNGYNNNMWVNYNTFNNPWAMNSFNSPMGWNNWNRPIGFGHGWGWNNGFNSMLGWNNGFNNMLGWDNGFNMGWNNMGFGLNSWNNNWNNPYSWNRPVVILNKFPTGSSYTSPSRGGSALNPYSRNNTFSRSGVNNSGFSRQSSNVRSIWETPGNNNSNSRNSMYRTIQRGGGVDGGNRSTERPVRTFENNSGGSNSGGSRSSSGSGSSGSGSAGSSSRGGRGG